MGLGFYQTVSIDEATQRRAIREDAEDAAGVYEAHSTPQRARVPSQCVEEPGEGLGGVHGIEHDALESRQLQHHVELFATDGGTSDSLIAIEKPDFGRRPHGEPEAAAREIHHLGYVRAYARSLPGDRHADDVGAKTRHLLGHQETGLAAAAEIGDRDRVELGRAVTHLLRDLLAARQVTERADHGGAALGDDVRHPAL